MSKSTNVRYVRVEIRPHLLRRFDQPTLMEAQIQVETEFDQYSLVEIIPEDDFTRRFDWYLDRAKREITVRVLKSSTE